VYVRENKILPRVAALAILHAETSTPTTHGYLE
jgi:hypothetical protein